MRDKAECQHYVMRVLGMLADNLDTLDMVVVISECLAQLARQDARTQRAVKLKLKSMFSSAREH